MLDYLGTSERLAEVMAYYQNEYEDELERQRKHRQRLKDQENQPTP